MSYDRLREFETGFARLLGVRHVAAVNSGTAALLAGMLALELPPGAEILSAAYTWPQVQAVADALGLQIRWADCDGSGRLTPQAVAKAITADTKAILVCHLFGNPVDVAGLVRLARERSIAVIEDCSQALLAKLHGHLVGTWGDIGFASLGRGKPLSAVEGGVIWTRHRELHDAIFALTQHPARTEDQVMQRKCLVRSLSLRMHPAGAELALQGLSTLADRVAATSYWYEVARILVSDLPGIKVLDVLPGATPAWTCLPVIATEEVADKLDNYWASFRPAYLAAADEGCAEAVAFDRRVRFLEPDGSGSNARSSDLFQWAKGLREAAER